MSHTVRTGVSLDESLLAQFDELIRTLNYENRSEAVRDLIRAKLVERDWEKARGTKVAVVCLVYDHHTHELPKKLTSIQHDDHSTIISSLHVHLDKDNCLEVLLLVGEAKRIRDLANRLTSSKGVKIGKSVLLSTGAGLA